MSSSGHAASSSGCAIRPRVQEIGSTGSAERIPSSSPTGRYAMATAEQWEPYESRGSRTVLGEPGGESPPGHSSMIGIGGSLAAPPLPHHRTYGSVYGGSRSHAKLARRSGHR